MPVYVYECQKCKKVIEIIQSITSEPSKTHKEIEENIECDGEVKRILQPANLKFKGKGWTPKFFRK